MTDTKKNVKTSGGKSGSSSRSKSNGSSASKSKSVSGSGAAARKTNGQTSAKKKTNAKKQTEFDDYKKTRKKAEYDPKEFESFREAERRREEEYLFSVNRRKVKDEVYIIAALVGAVLMILSYFNLCGIVGKAINTVLFGLLGSFAYAFPFVFFAMVVFLVMNRKNSVARKKVTFCIIVIICIAAIIHIVTIFDSVNLWQSFSVGYKEKSGGGFLGHILAWPLCTLFGKVAAVIIVVTLLIICFMMLTGTALLSLIKQKSKEEYSEISRKRQENEKIRQKEEYERNLDRMSIRSASMNSDSIDRPRIYAAESYNSDNISGGYSSKKNHESFLDKLRSGKNDETVVKRDNNTVIKSSSNSIDKNHELDMVEITGADVVVPAQESIYMQELNRKFGNKNDSVKTDEISFDNQIYNDREEDFDPVIVGADIKTEENTGNFGVDKNQGISSKSAASGVFARGDYRPQGTPEVKSHSLSGKQDNNVLTPVDNSDTTIKIIKKEPKTPKPYVFPPLSKLAKPTEAGKGTSAAELKETAKKLQDTLKSFGVNVTITNISCGPSVTRYELQPEQGVKVSKITSLADDIKLNLAASDIRMEAPIPGKAAIGIEVPNKVNQTVFFSSLISSSEFTNSKSNLTFAVGKDLGGQVIVHDIKKMPHLLVAGATGSGKSVCINTIIMSLLYKSSPEDVRLILIDPKVVELSVYNGIPHLLIPVVTDPKKASAALNWAVMEMTDRYKKFAELGVRDLEGYNKRITNQKEPEQSSSGEVYEKLPQIVIIIDELADLMMVAPGEVEDHICRLAQLARACGIHLVIATQRPSVNVITGLIKANVPSRIAFAVASQVDSRTIIDMGGAEKLLGKGDMLFYPSGYPKPVRVQGAFVSDAEVSAVVDFIKSHNDDNYNSDVENKMAEAAQAQSSTGQKGNSSQEKESEFDEYLYQSGSFIIQKEKASIGGLQRQFKIGFNRAARIMDQLCELGVVGPEEGTKPRQILMTIEVYEQFAESNGLK